MSGLIPRSFIDDLVARVDIVDVVDAYVPLKKAGRDHKACCPFHGEKTPSFTVSQQKQFYHCFGCGAHGTAIGFLMDYLGVDFVEAVEDLAARAGLEVPREAGQPGGSGEDLGPLYAVLDEANRFFGQQLRQHPQAARAIDYLKARGLSGEIAASFQIGFAPPGWRGLTDALGTGAERLRLLERAGLVSERSGGGHYDRFRERIVFPIHDRRGRVCGFGGRVLGDDTPKYLNSPETPVFHKGRELYGLHRARTRPGRLERVVVVEGYMDVVALAQHGVDNAVATLGTSATEDHLEQLFRTAPDVVFCFDGDAAGARAAWRALEIALPHLHEGRQAWFMFLAAGEDPDSVVQAGGQSAFEAAMDAAIPLGTFLFEHLSEGVDLATIDGRSRLDDLARPLLGRIAPGAFRDLAFRELEQLTGRAVAPESATLIRGGHRSKGREIPGGHREGSEERGATAARTPVRRALTMLVHYPALAVEVEEAGSLRSLPLPGADLLVGVVELLQSSPNLTTAAVVEHFRDDESGRHLGRLATESVAPMDEALRREFRDCLDWMRAAQTERRYAELLARERTEGLSDAERTEFLHLSTRAGRRGG